MVAAVMVGGSGFADSRNVGSERMQSDRLPMDIAEYGSSSIDSLLTVRVGACSVPSDVVQRLFEPLGSVELRVSLAVRYGTLLLNSTPCVRTRGAPIVRTSPSTASMPTPTVTWNETLQLGVLISDLPREAYVQLRVYAVSGAGKSVADGATSSRVRCDDDDKEADGDGNMDNDNDDDRDNNVATLRTLGWVHVSVFEFDAQLRAGTFNFALWPNKPPVCGGSGARGALSTATLAVPFADNAGDASAATISVCFVQPVPRVYWCRPVPAIDHAGDGGSNAADGKVARVDFDALSPAIRASLDGIIRRCNTSTPLTSAECRSLWQWRRALPARAHALPLVVRAAPFDSCPVCAVRDELHALLRIWPPLPQALLAIELLSAAIVDIDIRRWAVTQLERLSADELLSVLPALVHAVECELYHDSALARFLLRRAVDSKRVGQRLYWLVSVELQGAVAHATRLGVLLEAFVRADISARSSLVRQRELVSAFVGVVHATRAGAARDVGLRAVARRLASMRVASPLDCRVRLKRLVVEQCQLTVHSKSALLLAVFECERDHSIVNDIDDDNDDDDDDGGFGSGSGCISGDDSVLCSSGVVQNDKYILLFKLGIDARQEAFVFDAFRWLSKIWRESNNNNNNNNNSDDELINVTSTPSACVAMARDVSLCEMLQVATSLGSIVASGDTRQHTALLDWLVESGVQMRAGAERTLKRFAHSYAVHCVASSVLGVTVAHERQLMLRTNGDIFQNEFARLFGVACGELTLATPTTTTASLGGDSISFVLTRDIERALLGAAQSDAAQQAAWRAFVAYGTRAFGVLRQHASLLLALLAGTLPAVVGESTSVTAAALAFVAQTLRVDDSAASDADVWAALVTRARIVASASSCNARLHHAVASRGDNTQPRMQPSAVHWQCC